MNALVLTAVLSVAGALLAAQTPTPLPTAIDVPAGHIVVLGVQGRGVQIYTCGSGHWALKAPNADLIDSSGASIGKHFGGPTWQLNDGSSVRGKAIGSRPSPDPASVPWLLVQVVEHAGTGKLAAVDYIRRTDTHGGAAPSQPCTSNDIPVPYTATYTFYGPQQAR